MLPNESLTTGAEGGAQGKFAFAFDHGTVAGYYDGDLSSFRKWEEASRGVPGVTGFMYTTWQHKYDDLETYGQAMRGKEPRGR